jgi:hypothetical protein
MLKVILVKDPYAICGRCGGGTLPGDPLFKFGMFVEWITLHKSCFDEVAKGVEDLFANWKEHQKPSTQD